MSVPVSGTDHFCPEATVAHIFACDAAVVKSSGGLFTNPGYSASTMLFHGALIPGCKQSMMEFPHHLAVICPECRERVTVPCTSVIH